MFLFAHTCSLVNPSQLSYAPTFPEGEVIQNVTQLGPRFTVSFVVRNAGPSTIPVAQIIINWPLRLGGSENYLLYPFSVSVSLLPNLALHVATHLASVFKPDNQWDIHVQID